jgi:hypothetical protein
MRGARKHSSIRRRVSLIEPTSSFQSLPNRARTRLNLRSEELSARRKRFGFGLLIICAGIMSRSSLMDEFSDVSSCITDAGDGGTQVVSVTA